jgi:NDP-sugar pyrophosphorylase family protein
MMTDSTYNCEPLVVILAGGQAARFGLLGRMLPKSLLPVSQHQTLLSRNLDHLHEAGLRNVTVSTSPETYDLLHPFMDKYRQIRNEGEVLQPLHLELICNEMHRISSLAALNEIISRREFQRYIMCFADIYFRENPFVPLLNSARTGNGTNFIAGFPEPSEKDIARGGLVMAEGASCKRLYLTAAEFSSSQTGKPLSWPGITVFDSAVSSNLSEFLRDLNSPVEEEFINFCIDRGRKFTVFEIAHFINVNGYGDFLEALNCDDA